jgi:hypothetical protein
MRIRTPTVLAIGAWQSAEFAPLLQELDPQTQWPTFATWPEALFWLGRGSVQPDIVLCAQARPGAVDQDAIERLCRTSPLTRTVVVAGTWCEGELRTGQPPQGVVRLYWYEFAAWWRAAIRRSAAGLSPPWAEPVFDSRAGQFIENDHETFEFSSNERRLIAIDSLDYDAFEALQLGLRGLGWDAVWQPRHRPELGRGGDLHQSLKLAAGIWDGGQLDESERTDLRSFCSRLRNAEAPVMVLLDFPRVEHLQAARESGAAAVLAKPYQLALLHDELIRLFGLV